MRAATTEIIARALIRDDNRVLVARKRGKRWAFLPGGHVDPGEPVEAALVRELAEELGTTSRIVRFIGVVEHGYVDDDGNARHEVNLIFGAELDDIPVSQEEHLEFDWLPMDQIATADLRPSAMIGSIVGIEGPVWHGWSG
ncbi:NUDIX domain-containing protein [Nocardia sp. KC 131]|uniref:NUDIX domain-containing protein n=1 Tax=Nocardia arseniciresistens TaxID=3392119 RepID=UPI00398F13C5